MMRSFQPREAAPLLWASTYQAGEALPEGAPARGDEVRCGAACCPRVLGVPLVAAPARQGRQRTALAPSLVH
jgi:hypothetical protein